MAAPTEIHPAEITTFETLIPARPQAAVRSDPWAALWLLGLGAVAELAIWWGFVQPYRLDQYYQTLNPYPLDLAKINRATPDSANAWALTWIVLFAVSYLAYRRAPAHPTRVYWLVLVLGVVLFNATLLFMFPVGAADLFDQVFRGRILGHYGANPFLTPPNLYPDDPLRAWVGGWAATGSPYGPAWELPAAATAWLAETVASWLPGADLLLVHLLLFKALVVSAYGGAALLIWATLRRLWPEWAVRGLLLFAWNPLVLFETAGNGHNDMVMIAWVLAACYLLARGGRGAILAPAALMAAALVKFVPLVLLPLALVLLWYDDGRRAPENAEPNGHAEMHDAAWGEVAAARRRGRARFWQRARRVLIAAVLAGLLAIGVYAPFWQGKQTLGALARQDLFTASFPKVAVDFLVAQLTNAGSSADAIALATSQAESWVRSVAVGLLVGWLLVQMIRLWWTAQDQAGPRALLYTTYSAMYEVLFVYLLFATLWFQPWYTQWLIALAPLALSRTRVGRTYLFAAGAVGNYFVWDFLWLWNRATFRTIQITAAAVINAPTLLYTIYTWLRPPETRTED